jgi:hypothetical protein
MEEKPMEQHQLEVSNTHFRSGCGQNSGFLALFSAQRAAGAISLSANKTVPCLNGTVTRLKSEQWPAGLALSRECGAFHHRFHLHRNIPARIAF